MPSLISGLNLADLPAATIETNSEVPGLGVRSLLTPRLGEVWRTGSGTTRTLWLDLGSAQWVRTIALFAPRDGVLPEASAQVDLSISAVAKGGDELGKAGDLLVVDAAGRVTTDMQGADFVVRNGLPFSLPRGLWCWVLPEPTRLRFVQIVITSTQPYLQFSRLWVGPALLPLRDPSPNGYAPGGIDDNASLPRRNVRFNLATLSESEADALETIALEAGTQRQVFVVPRIERADRTGFFGKFTTIPMPSPQQAWNERGRIYAADIAAQEDR
ncbi:hypothetical protein EBE87_20300 [Pseudoroseomonas wenyumeiae]|uniref:Uncharacterized protein n=1 Tax=Teichococcus wenyumeiae TaxID=2478470 RepID=A0A3A9JJS6_9PROT|nr:hypothetical protein [Pseudoroseomonas wenyumeiae]RKK04825.1 hypothetical protein D6Z83_07575 [Pseudoroseomonas wenyumeiae]RMI19493.1 hypothetical protein EBE87_20300 [Pseudoroseomonas wenyumeiae]